MSDGHVHSKHDYTASNEKFFNEQARGLQDSDSHPHHSVERARREIPAMRAAWPDLFDEGHTMAMDYACGIGTLSRELCQYVKSVVGVDISQASVDHYNNQASNQGLAPDEMRAICAELKGEPGELDGSKFDIILCCASYHHFPSIENTTRILSSFLKPGGSLLVADIKAADDGHELFPETYHHIVAHKHGLSEEMVREAFESAGLVEVEIKDAFRAKMRATSEEVQWLIVRGVKPR